MCCSVEGKNAQTRFLSGCKLHSFVDEKRGKFATDSKIYAWLEEECKENLFLQLAFMSHKYILLCILEDEIIREKFPVQDLTKYFDKIHAEEIDDGITGKDVEAWHNFLNAYFNGEISDSDEIPSQHLCLCFLFEISLGNWQKKKEL